MAFPPDRSLYPFQKKLDVRAACARALATHLRGLDLELTSRDLKRFTKVFEEWADFEDKHEPPSACVLPGSGTYEDRALGPSPLEDTWRPKAQDGYVLWKVGEYVVSLDVYVRARDRAQRHALLGALEDAFVPASLGSLVDPDRDTYGILLPVPDYYDREARFTLKSNRVDDLGAMAAGNVREGVVSVEAHAEHLVVRPVHALYPRVAVTPNLAGG